MPPIDYSNGEPNRAIFRWVAVLGVLAALGTVLLTIGGYRELNRPAGEAKVVVTPPVLPAIKTLEKPLAIIVLDVSSSMTRNDPDGQQAEAVKTFLRVYQSMVHGSLVGGDTPRVAVILFATGAQVVEWPAPGGGWSPFLEVPAAPEQLGTLLQKHLLEFIEKTAQRDPRAGAFTDYLAALQVVRTVLDQAQAKGPPCVVFMTDGHDNPFGPLASRERPEQRKLLEQLAGRVTAAVRDQYRNAPDKVRRAEQAERNLLAHWSEPEASVRHSGTPWDPPRDYYEAIGGELWAYVVDEHRKLFEDSGKFPQTHEAALHQVLGQLVGRNFNLKNSPDQAPLIWEFIYLGRDAQPLQSLAKLGRACQRSQEYWGLPGQGVIYCQKASELPASFLDVLGRWLNLDKVSLGPGADSFFVEPRTGGIGLLVETAPQATAVTLVSPEGHAAALTRGPISQGRCVWFLAQSGPAAGAWRVQADPPIAGGTLWVRHRFVWAFGGIPRYLTSLSADPQLTLQLFDIASGKEEDLEALYEASSLPTQVEVNLGLAAGAPGRAVFQTKRNDRGQVTGYAGLLPRKSVLEAGQVRLVAQLEGLRPKGSLRPAAPVRIESQLAVGQTVEIQLQNREGQALSSVELEGALPGTSSVK